ncbi:MAG: hypothetical protein QOI38_103 [Sphingomonadales bacterium]|jgi:hypothetical protein|nr:hypothetical protein [Sphingomonadales bacterium]
MRGAATLLLALAAIGAAVPASAQPPLTHAEARRLPPDRLARRVFGDLARTLLPVPLAAPNGWGGDVLRDMLFLTPAQYAGEAGLCATDQLVVRFEPVGPLDGADTPVRARRMELSTEYFVRDLGRIVAPVPAEDDEEEQRREERACAAADPRSFTRIRAQEGAIVVQGLRLASAVIRAAREGRALVPIACRLDDSEREASLQPDCLADIAALRLDRVNLIGDCYDPAVPGTPCFDLSDWSTQLRIWVRPGSQEPVRAAIERVIIIT